MGEGESVNKEMTEAHVASSALFPSSYPCRSARMRHTLKEIVGGALILSEPERPSALDVLDV